MNITDVVSSSGLKKRLKDREDENELQEKRAQLPGTRRVIIEMDVVLMGG